LQEIDDDSIWNSYKKVVPNALKEIMPESVKPETLHILARFTGRLFLDMQEESKEPQSRQLAIVDTVPRKEFDSLKSQFDDVKAKLDVLMNDYNLLRQELHCVRNDPMSSQLSRLNK
jgi:hypothetical protein